MKETGLGSYAQKGLSGLQVEMTSQETGLKQEGASDLMDLGGGWQALVMRSVKRIHQFKTLNMRENTEILAFEIGV